MKTVKENPELLRTLDCVRILSKLGQASSGLMVYAKRRAREEGATESQIEIYWRDGVFQRESRPDKLTKKIEII